MVRCVYVCALKSSACSVTSKCIAASERWLCAYTLSSNRWKWSIYNGLCPACLLVSIRLFFFLSIHSCTIFRAIDAPVNFFTKLWQKINFHIIIISLVVTDSSYYVFFVLHSCTFCIHLPVIYSIKEWALVRVRQHRRKHNIKSMHRHNKT